MQINETFGSTSDSAGVEVIEQICEELMDYHGLDGWTFKIDVNSNTTGQDNADYNDKRDHTLDREYALRCHPARPYKQTIIHEIAHAFTRATTTAQNGKTK